ncbi:MAG: cation diffusion facilitator family transporter [Gammaproteobacteria bacterium]|nr:cation diffusion facilitator family transporter [Gammaproteobacteria bacterium]
MTLAAATPHQYARLLRLATYASVVTATVLIVGKLTAVLLTGSVSVMASLIDSLMDVAASLINLFAVRYSLMPADEEHRFGHGKAESLAGLAQAMFIAGSALFLMLHAVDRLLNPQPLHAIGVGIGVMIFAIAATMILLAIQRYVIARTGSTAVRADSLHYMTDLLTNASIIVALALSMTGWPGLDPIFALGIAFYILHSAWTIGHEAFHLLMDRELPDSDRERIRQIALAHPEVRGLHDLRSYRSGQREIVQFHMELDGSLSLREAHGITEAVLGDIQKAYPVADIVIRQDPVNHAAP